MSDRFYNPMLQGYRVKCDKCGTVHGSLLSCPSPSAPAPDADGPLAPRADERRVAAFDVRIYASPPDPDLPERIATSYRAVVRGVETGTVAESTSPVGSWALLRALREGARLVRELEQENGA